MSRLIATLGSDLRFQVRQPSCTLCWLLAFSLGTVLALKAPQGSAPSLLPSMILLGLGGAAHFMVIFAWSRERTESPFRLWGHSGTQRGTYLASKVLTATVLSMACGLIWFGLGSNSLHLRPVPFLTGVFLVASFYALLALVRMNSCQQSERYALMDGCLLVLLSALPILGELDLLSNPLWYLWPSQPALLFLHGAFRPLATWQWLYAGIYGTAILFASALWARVALERHLALE